MGATMETVSAPARAAVPTPGVAAGATSTAVSATPAPWGATLAALRQWAAEAEGVRVSPDALSVARPVREDFYARVDEAAALLAAAVLGERAAWAERLAAALAAVRAEVEEASDLGRFGMPTRLEAFAADPLRALAEPLSSLVLDVVSGRRALWDVDGAARAEVGRSAAVLLRSAYEAWAYLGVVAALRPVRFWAVASEDGRVLRSVPADEVSMGRQVPSRELRHPEAVFQTADGRTFAMKCEAAREIDYYSALTPPARDTSAGGSTENLLGHRVLLLYRLDGPEAVRPLVDRKAKVQVPVDLACTVLAPREMSAPGMLGTFIERARTLRTRGPVQVLSFDEKAAFPAEMATDAEAPAVQVSAIGLDRAALAEVAGRAAGGTGPAMAVPRGIGK